MYLADPAFLTSLQNLALSARLVVEGFVSGRHRGASHGYSLEFVEHRDYHPGDEPRHIDWKVSGRRDRLYVRKFQEETNLRAYLLLDVSGSMGYRSHALRLEKLSYGKYLAAALAYLTLRQQDMVGLALFADAIRTYLPASGARGQFHRVVHHLEEVQAGGRTAPLPVFQELAVRLRRRGLILLLSDLLTDVEGTLRGLCFFRHRKHEVVVFHLLDPGELSLNLEGYLEVRDAETGEEQTIDALMIKAEYDRAVAKEVESYRRVCREAGIAYQLLTTDRPLGVALRRFLHRRAKMLR